MREAPGNSPISQAAIRRKLMAEVMAICCNRVRAMPSGNFDVFRCGDRKDQNIDLENEMPLNVENNPTNWRTLTLAKTP